MVDPDRKLLTNQICVFARGVFNVSSDTPFKILISNTGSTLIELGP